jgi:hypothetical protein
MDIVQRHNSCTNVPSSQTFRSYSFAQLSNWTKGSLLRLERSPMDCGDEEFRQICLLLHFCPLTTPSRAKSACPNIFSANVGFRIDNPTNICVEKTKMASQLKGSIGEYARLENLTAQEGCGGVRSKKFISVWFCSRAPVSSSFNFLSLCLEW